MAPVRDGLNRLWVQFTMGAVRVGLSACWAQCLLDSLPVEFCSLDGYRRRQAIADPESKQARPGETELVPDCTPRGQLDCCRQSPTRSDHTSGAGSTLSRKPSFPVTRTF